MGNPSGLYREYSSSLLLEAITNMASRSSTGKQFTNTTLRLSRYSLLFSGRISLFSR
jgi:hypothetical protein